MSSTRVLLTGSTGFVGRHIYGDLVAAGYEVLCATRDVEKARQKDSQRQYRALDLEDPRSVREALRDVQRAVYLVHSMADSNEYAEREAENARTFAALAEEQGLDRIVYLGGMRPRSDVSRHLASRLRTGEILRAGKVPCVELQATMVIGGGSESFRIVRDLSARLPFMLLPKWLDSESEPVAIRDVGAAIAHALAMPLEHSEVFTLPGPERLSGRAILLRTARLLGNAPHAIRVPVVTPRLSSYWIRLITRADPQVAAELVEGLRSDILSNGLTLWEKMPDFARTPFDEAVRTALAEEERALPESAKLVEHALHRIAAQR